MRPAPGSFSTPPSPSTRPPGSPAHLPSPGSTATPPSPRFNAASHEHTLVFHDLAQTTLHLRLDHFQFLDWDVLPRRRAAMLAPRAAVTMMMVMDRVLLKLQRQKLADFALGKEQQTLSFPPGTPALRALVYIMQNSTKDFETIFREHVWKSVAAPPDLVAVGRVADARRARAAEAIAAAAAAAVAAPSGGGSSSSSKKKKREGRRRRGRVGGSDKIERVRSCCITRSYLLCRGRSYVG